MLSTLLRIPRFWRRRRLLGAGLALSMLLRTLFAVVLAVSIKTIIDGVTGESAVSIASVLAVLGGAYVISATAGILGGYLTAVAGASILSDVRTEVFRHLQRLSLGFHDRSQAGHLIAGFSTDIAQVLNGVVRKPLEGLLSIVSLGFYLPVMIVLEPRLGIVAAVGMPIVIYFVNRFAPDADAPLDQEKGHVAAVLSEVSENLSAQPAIRAFGLRNRAHSRFDERIERLRATSITADYRVQILSVASNFGVAFVQLVVVGIGATMALSGDLTAGTFAAFVALLTEFTYEVTVIGGSVLPGIRQASSGIRRIDSLLAEGPIAHEPSAPVSAPDVADSIRFEDIQFGYADAAPTLLNGLTLEIPAGQFVAVVGPSGSGKSTLLSLLLRFYEPSAGQVLIDSVDVMDVASDDLVSRMGVVFQDTFLFDATLRENIVMEQDGVTEAELQDAIVGAGLSDLVERLPEGLDTGVGSGGQKVSGGQKQRIGIARAIVRNPRLLLLDEVTAALDPATEQDVNATVTRLRAGRTIITVTHRLAIVKDADLIVVVNDGRIAESGTFDELHNLGGIFVGMWEKQHGFTLSSDGRDASVDADRLKLIPLFAMLDDDRLANVAERLRPESFRPDEDIFAQGKPGDRFYVIARGTARVIVGSEAEERDLAYLEDGDFFGEMALLDDAPRNATVRALTPMTTLSLDRNEFEDLLGGAAHAGDAVRAVALARSAQNRDG